MAIEMAFDGLGCLPANVALTAALVPYSIDVGLASTPGTMTTVQLDMTVRAVRLYAPDQSVRFALDMQPDVPQVALGTTISWAQLLLGPGDTLSPNAWLWVWVPNTFGPHTLVLRSPGGGMVNVIAYKEIE